MNINEAKALLKDDLAFQAITDFGSRVLESLSLPREAKVLDIGTGEGNMAVTLGLHGYHVVTGEPEDDATPYGKKDWKSKAEKLQVDRLITFKPLRGDNLPFDDGWFDAVFLFGCLHHMPPEIRSAVLKECIRATSNDGLICVVEPTPAALETIRRVDPEHPDAADPLGDAQGLRLSVERKIGDFFTAFIFHKDL